MKTNGYLSIIVIVITSSIIILGCSKSEVGESLLIYYSKSECFGNCEVYSIDIYDNGDVNYVGIKNVDHIGKYSSKLDDESIQIIKQSFDDVNITDYSDFYIAQNKRDLPKITLQYKDKRITYNKRKAPKTILKLAQIIEDHIANLKLSTMP